MSRAAQSATRAIALSAALVAAAVEGTASGQDAGGAAGRAFQAGSQAYAHGDFRAAAASFDEAYRIAPRGAAAYNAGLSWEAAGEAARACDDYARALRASDLGTVERADTTGRLKNLEGRVGRLSILAPDDARLWLDGTDVTDAARGLHVAPGRHALRIAYADQKEETRTVRVAAGEAVEVRPVERVDHDAEETATSKTPQPAATDAPASSKLSDHLPAFATFGGGIVASVLAIYFFERGLSARNGLEQDLSDSSLHDQAETFRALTWVSWSVAAVCAGVGTYLYLTDTPASSSSAPSSGAALRLAPGSVSLHVGF